MFNTVPANGWPQLKQLQELADKVDNMPTYTSDDRDFLDTWESVLPISDEVDPGQYTLMATKSELGATYSWEEPASGLPEDPAADGTNLLLATTESGETTKSWIAESLFLMTSGGKIVDCNNEKSNAMIRVRETSTNMPTGLTDGILLVFKPSTTDNVCVQIFVASGGQAFIRTYWYNEWKAWRTMAS